MSGIILESLKRKFCGEDIDLDGQIKFYQDYWDKRGVNLKENKSG